MGYRKFLEGQENVWAWLDASDAAETVDNKIRLLTIRLSGPERLADSRWVIMSNDRCYINGVGPMNHTKNPNFYGRRIFEDVAINVGKEKCLPLILDEFGGHGHTHEPFEVERCISAIRSRSYAEQIAIVDKQIADRKRKSGFVMEERLKAVRSRRQNNPKAYQDLMKYVKPD